MMLCWLHLRLLNTRRKWKGIEKLLKQMMFQVTIETIRSQNLQLLQNRGTILTMQMNVLKSSMERNHWITSHLCMPLIDVEKLTFNDSEL